MPDAEQLQAQFADMIERFRKAEDMADIANGATCGRSGCGHPGSMHADVGQNAAGGQNSGACQADGCDCSGFQGKTAAAVDAVVLATDIAGPSTATDVDTDGPAFRSVLIQEGVDTQDGRRIDPHALTWRELPLPLMVLTSTGPGGHQGAEIGGRIDEITREPGTEPGTFDIVGRGRLDTGAVGAEAARLIGSRTLRGVSGDLVDCDSTVTILAEDEDGWPTEILETVTAGVFAAATVCPIPAFAACVIELVDSDAATEEGEVPALVASGFELPAFTIERICLPCTARVGDAMTASGGPLAPPAAWFNDPALEQLTALTVTDDGRLFGHLAGWGTCHIGYEGQCVNPPYSATNYAGFRLGLVRTDDGTDVRTGPVTLGGGHADPVADATAARAHYDDTGTVVADVTCGEDSHGIWVAGALRPDVTDLQVRQLRACGGLSGDWRRIGGGLELVAALAVNVPGFPISRVAAGVPESLVAAGARPVTRRAEPWRADMDDAIGRIRAQIDADLAQVRADRVMRRIRR